MNKLDKATTKFERIAINMINSATSPFQVQKIKNQTCNVCASSGMSMLCDGCSIETAANLRIAAIHSNEHTLIEDSVNTPVVRCTACSRRCAIGSGYITTNCGGIKEVC